MAGLQALSQSNAQRHLMVLRGFIEGEFSNKIQAKQDTGFSEIEWSIRQVWKKRKDGLWFYMEQRPAGVPAKTIQQRMGHFYVQDDSTIVLQYFDFKEPDTYVGWARTPKRFDSVKFYALRNRTGCEVFVRKDSAGVYAGTTDGKDCRSNEAGATYTTSSLRIRSGSIHIWERDWNADGVQVSGSRKGPYQFQRQIKKK